MQTSDALVFGDHSVLSRRLFVAEEGMASVELQPTKCKLHKSSDDLIDFEV